MSDRKKYYWLKLKDDFFKRHDMRIVEAMENGEKYVLFYLKLLAESTSHEGELRFSELIPYDDEMLAIITNTDVDVVRSAVKVLQGLNLVEVFDDGTLYMAEVQKLLGSETNYAIQKRRQRGSKVDNVQAMSSKCLPEIDIELDIDKELDIIKGDPEKPKKPVKHKIGEYKNVLLTDVEVDKLADKLGSDYERMIITMDEGIEMKGYKYRSHYMAILHWYRNEQKNKTAPTSRKAKTDQAIRDFVEGEKE